MSRTRSLRTPEKNWDAFIEALERGLSIANAARAAGVGYRTAFDHRQRDEQFALRWADAVEKGTDRLEDHALDMALSGDTTMTIFLLKARRPDKYRDTVKVDQTTTIRDERVRKAAQARPELLEELARTLAGEPA